MRAIAAALLALGVVGCIQVVRVEEPPPPRVPPRFEAEAPPPLQETGVPGLLSARALDPASYYDQNTEQWYRWAYNEWFVAFTWDGAWFPLPEKERPAYLAGLHTAPEPKAVRDQLKDLERQLEELDEAAQLRELERQLEAIDAAEEQAGETP